LSPPRDRIEEKSFPGCWAIALPAEEKRSLDNKPLAKVLILDF
jgi:hypothetical protein